MKLAALVLVCTALPGLADSGFAARRMKRDDVPPGKGQCDIRLQVDGEVEVSLRGDKVSIRTIAGRDARNDGSECNASLPKREIADFRFEAIDSRGETRLLAGPSEGNGFTALVHIGGDAGRCHFRLSWTTPGKGNERPKAGAGFSANNTVSYRGTGHGTSSLNGAGDVQLGEANVEVDRGGKLVAWFRTGERGRPLTFTGQILASEGGRWKADVVSGDGRLRGPMWITVDERRQVQSISLEATDGRDRMLVNWSR